MLPGPPVPAVPLLGRAEERERIVRLLGRGRSVRLTGPAGSGRSALLDVVARDCAGLAPDGVVRLSGYGLQQPAELLYALYAAVYEAPDRRPDRTELLARAGEIGAVVLLDDLELGGAALDELLRATPECAYLLAAAPDTKSPSDDVHLEEVFLGGLGRADCVTLLEARTGRPLTDEETAWAGDLRFASEGLPLRFVQAAALLRQRDEINRMSAPDEDEEPGVFEERPVTPPTCRCPPSRRARPPPNCWPPGSASRHGPPCGSPARWAANSRTTRTCPRWSVTRTPTPPSRNCWAAGWSPPSGRATASRRGSPGSWRRPGTGTPPPRRPAPPPGTTPGGPGTPR